VMQIFKMDLPGVFYHSGTDGGGSSDAPPPGTFFNDQDQEMYRGNEQGGSGDSSAFDSWFANHGMDYQSSDSPEAGQQQSRAARMMEQHRPMTSVQMQQLHQHPMFGHPGPMPPFLNYDSMGLMPAHHLPLPPPPPMLPPPHSLPMHQPPLSAATAAAALFPGPQIFSSCASQVGSSIAVPSTSFLPFDHMQLTLHHHPSTSMSQQQHMQQLQQQQQTTAAADAAAIHNAYSASASDSSSQITTVLMAFRQGGEETEFVRKAIESLVKKLKDKRLELEALIQAVTSNGKTPTCCVTIQRSLDGRLQVAGRKGVPHVVYARIWRWPNVAKTELSKLPMCRVMPDNQDFICINPYHYERVVSNAGGMMATHEQQPVSKMPVLQQQLAATATPPVYGLQLPFDGRGDEWPSSQITLTSAAALQADIRMAQQLQQQSGETAEFRGSMFPAVEPPVMHRAHSIDLNRVIIPPAQHYPNHWCTINYFEHDTQFGESFKVRREMMSVRVDGGLDPQGERNSRFCVGAISNVHRAGPVEVVRQHIGMGVVLKQHQDGRVTMEVRSNKAVFVRAPYMDYMKHTPYTTTIHKVQQCDGEITIFDLKWSYFEMCEQTASAKEAVVAQARAVAGLPVNHPGMQQMSDMVAGSGVDEMKRMFCSVAMSFVKGFGGQYNRKNIKDCPCWIEVELHRPLQLLDQLLKRSYI
ncbi:sma-4, partial [Pristionchus pacificus]